MQVSSIIDEVYFNRTVVLQNNKPFYSKTVTFGCYKR
jgi:hypothetical protein